VKDPRLSGYFLRLSVKELTRFRRKAKSLRLTVASMIRRAVDNL
jgi:hypothetical protein